MKRIVAVILSLLLVCGAVAIAEIDLSGMALEELRALQRDIALAIADQVGNSIVSEGTVLTDNEYCKVTLTGLEMVRSRLRLNVIVENRADKELHILVEQIVVNGWSLSGYGVPDIAPRSNKMSDIEVKGEPDDYGVASVEDVSEIRLILRILTDDGWTTLYETEEITLTFGQTE